MTSTSSEETKTITNHMVFVWRNALEASKDLERTFKQPFRFFSSKKGSFTIIKDGISVFNAIISELKKRETIRQNFSDKYLENTLRDSILELLPVEEKEILQVAEQRTITLITELSKSPIIWRIIVPIVNFELEMKEISVGNVKFHEVDTKEILDELKRINSTSKSPQEVLKLFESRFETDTLPRFEGKICADVTVSAVDNERAVEIVLEMIETTLDVLRFYRFNPIFPEVRYYRNYIDINGRIYNDIQRIICFGNLPKIERLNISSKNTGFFFPFKISNAALKEIQNDNFIILDKILKKTEQQRTKIERNIVTAIYFCALSSRSEEDTNSIINCAISLESLLLKRESIIDNLAERIAFLNGRNVDEKKWLFKQTRRLYEIRNSIVHNGETDIRDSDILLFQRINYRSIVNFLYLYQLENFNSTKNFIQWVRKQKFR